MTFSLPSRSPTNLPALYPTPPAPLHELFKKRKRHKNSTKFYYQALNLIQTATATDISKLFKRQVSSRSEKSILHRLAHWNNCHLVKEVLERGINPNLPDSKKRTPLHMAVQPRVNEEKEIPCESSEGQVERTELNDLENFRLDKLEQKRADQINTVRYLLKYGADPDLVDSEGKTALNYATDPDIQLILKEHALNEKSECLLSLPQPISTSDDACNASFDYVTDPDMRSILTDTDTQSMLREHATLEKSESLPPTQQARSIEAQVDATYQMIEVGCSVLAVQELVALIQKVLAIQPDLSAGTVKKITGWLLALFERLPSKVHKNHHEFSLWESFLQTAKEWLSYLDRYDNFLFEERVWILHKVSLKDSSPDFMVLMDRLLLHMETVASQWLRSKQQSAQYLYLIKQLIKLSHCLQKQRTDQIENHVSAIASLKIPEKLSAVINMVTTEVHRLADSENARCYELKQSFANSIISCLRHIDPKKDAETLRKIHALMEDSRFKQFITQPQLEELKNLLHFPH